MYVVIYFNPFSQMWQLIDAKEDSDRDAALELVSQRQKSFPDDKFEMCVVGNHAFEALHTNHED